MFAGNKNNAVLMSDSPRCLHIYQIFTLAMQNKVLKVTFQGLTQQYNALQFLHAITLKAK